MNEIIEMIKDRRTIRKFKYEQIEKNELEAIISAGLYAPSAGGRQSVIIAVSNDFEVNKKLGEGRRMRVKPKMANGNNFISKEHPSIADDPNIIDAFYGAPTLITLFAPKDFFLAKWIVALLLKT
ncbi:MAG: nitroreductase family protein [Lachnospirales bacterium]